MTKTEIAIKIIINHRFALNGKRASIHSFNALAAPFDLAPNRLPLLSSNLLFQKTNLCCSATGKVKVRVVAKKGKLCCGKTMDPVDEMATTD